ncbi:MAG: hypothetical protein GXY83_12715 [Rhodopirellula sp.]|nr:hypothetical protein [Rhodopirellula sp.]
MSVHRIRLREPWRHLRVEGNVQWRRKFNRPSGLGPEQRIWIEVKNRSRGVAVYLNGRHLGETPAGAEAVRFELTGLLDLHNEITLMSTDAPQRLPSPLPAEVSLEIVDLGS